MPRRKTKEQFIDDSQRIHGNAYDYSLVEYINNKTKVKILCPVHGIFAQIPTDHIGKKATCPHCAQRAPGTVDTFIQAAIEIHGDKYDYSLVEYKNNKTKVKIKCSMHGIFEMTPKSHIIQKQNCKKCSDMMCGINSRKTTKQFILEAREIHGDKYDYSLVRYTTIRGKVEIVCKEHGSFYQTPDGHLYGGNGCPQCGYKRRGSMGGYCYDYFEKNPLEKNIQGKLYIVEMTGKSDHFIKVGITKRTIKERFAVSGLGDKYFNKRIIHELSIPLYDAWLLEQKILEDLREEYQYFPNYKFSGQTECFKVKNIVLECIDGHISNSLRRK